jgi:hypothetical protein
VVERADPGALTDRGPRAGVAEEVVDNPSDSPQPLVYRLGSGLRGRLRGAGDVARNRPMVQTGLPARLETEE